MRRGYVKLWRKTEDSAIFQNKNAFILWSYCLMKATHKPRVAMVGNQVIELRPGQFIFGRDKASEQTPLTVQEIRTSLKVLKKLSMISVKSTNKFSIISVINWEFYQSDECTANQHLTNKEPTDNQQITTDKHSKHIKNRKNNTPPTPPAGKTEIEIPAWMPLEKWNEFIKFRKSLKPPITDYAQTLAIKKLERFREEGHDIDDIISTTIENGWKGFFAPKNKKRNGGNLNVSTEFGPNTPEENLTWLN